MAISAGIEVKGNSPESSNKVSETTRGTKKATPTNARPKTVPGKLTETIDDGFGIMRDAHTAKP